MDPFLEHPAFYHSLHQAMIVCFREQLQPLFSEPYYADMEDRTWIEMTEQTRHAEQDVNVLRGDQPSRRKPEQGGIAVAEAATTKPVVITIPHHEEHESYLNVYARLDDREIVVTTIEVLSPANKTTGATGRSPYVEKQQQGLRGETHLIEIDLLRCGTHSTAIPLDRLKARIPTFDYHVCIKHFDNLEDYLIYPVLLPERLPIIAVPLLPGDGFVPLDLQKALDRSYDTGPYSRRVRYTDPVPGPALSEERAKWLQQVLRDKKLVPPT
jgi:hypothetical protein